MWIFLNNAFVSLVADKDNPDNLMIRARRAGDINRAFGAKVRTLETPQGDYRFRASIPRERVAAVIAATICHVSYTNFKDSVPDRNRHDAYLGVWREMYWWQERHTPRPQLLPLKAPEPPRREITRKAPVKRVKKQKGLLSLRRRA